MDIKPAEITDILKREIKEYDREVDVAETGTVLSVGDGIARVFGLDSVMAGELVELPGGLTGLVLNLEEDNVGIAVMGETHHVREGDSVRRTGRILEVPVGMELRRPRGRRARRIRSTASRRSSRASAAASSSRRPASWRANPCTSRCRRGSRRSMP